jgi:hypothetical protein
MATDEAATVHSEPVEVSDDLPTVCAISLVAGILADVLHEGLGHAATALLTGAKSGVLSTVAWSSEFDSRLVAAAGTLANLAAVMIFWAVLRSTTGASVRMRFFFLVSVAYNVFDGTGYLLFSGVTNFGDWAAVIAGMPAHWLWRTLLVVSGVASYYAAALVVGTGLVRYVGVPRNDPRRLRKLLIVPYFTSVVLAAVAGLLNPVGVQLVWQSALPGSAGAHSGLLWLRYCIPKEILPGRPSGAIGKSYAWIVQAAVLSMVFVLVLGRGIRL